MRHSEMVKSSHRKRNRRTCSYSGHTATALHVLSMRVSRFANVSDLSYLACITCIYIDITFIRVTKPLFASIATVSFFFPLSAAFCLQVKSENAGLSRDFAPWLKCQQTKNVICTIFRVMATLYTETHVRTLTLGNLHTAHYRKNAINKRKSTVTSNTLQMLLLPQPLAEVHSNRSFS